MRPASTDLSAELSFYNPKTDASRQADFFIRSVKLESGDLPPVLDIEVRGEDEKKLRRDLKVWLE